MDVGDGHAQTGNKSRMKEEMFEKINEGDDAVTKGVRRVIG